MPTLSSGHTVGVYAEDFLRTIVLDEGGELVHSARPGAPAIHTVQDLGELLPVTLIGSVEFPHATMVAAGFRVCDVRAGRALWTAQEVEEFLDWLEGHAPLWEKLEPQLMALQVRQAAWRKAHGVACPAPAPAQAPGQEPGAIELRFLMVGQQRPRPG